MVCNYFKEEYNPSNIFTNWLNIDIQTSKQGSMWSFVTNPTKYGLSIHNGMKIRGNVD